jgi:hypothetical protein
VEGNYLYTAWQVGADSYLLVVHVAGRTEPFTFDLRPAFGSAVHARRYFGDVAAEVAGSTLNDSFDAYATRVYAIN